MQTCLPLWHPTLDRKEWRSVWHDQLFIIHAWWCLFISNTEVRSSCTTFGARDNTSLHWDVVLSFTGLRIPDGPVLPYLSSRPVILSRARCTEIIPRKGLGRRAEKTRTCFRRAGYKEPRCFSWSNSCSWSGSSLPLHHHPVVERRYSVMSSGTSAQ